MNKEFTRLEKVWEYVSDGNWHTLQEIAKATGYGEASVSSQLRDFRKPFLGGFIVKKRASGLKGPSGGPIFEYQVSAP